MRQVVTMETLPGLPDYGQSVFESRLIEVGWMRVIGGKPKAVVPFYWLAGRRVFEGGGYKWTAFLTPNCPSCNMLLERRMGKHGRRLAWIRKCPKCEESWFDQYIKENRGILGWIRRVIREFWRRCLEE